LLLLLNKDYYSGVQLLGRLTWKNGKMSCTAEGYNLTECLRA